MRPARILLLLVALLAGGLAAFLATRGNAPAEPQTITQVIEEPKSQVLVASQAIGVGQRLNESLVEWQDWPSGAIRPEYLTIDAMPDAPVTLMGSVARFEIFPGEPIRETKLVRADQGYLSAVLPEGMRAVSIGVSAVSASGGFIVPNDRVDVVLTRTGAQGDVSETILPNVKVLAIGKRLGQVGTTGTSPTVDPADPSTQVFDDSTIATLELTPVQGETLINASSAGRLSLALRSIADFGETQAVARQNASQSIRVIRYGREMNVMSANPAAAPPSAPQVTVAPATVIP